jgi:hypothetical protein
MNQAGHALNHSAQFLVVQGEKYLLFLLIYLLRNHISSIDEEET